MARRILRGEEDELHVRNEQIELNFHHDRLSQHAMHPLPPSSPRPSDPPNQTRANLTSS
jgi:hypothetical protein